eukprot:14454376-Heterocapsa_arctica.AAC.1
MANAMPTTAIPTSSSRAASQPQAEPLPQGQEDTPRDSVKFGQKQMITDNNKFEQFNKDIKNIAQLVLNNFTVGQDDSKLVKFVNEASSKGSSTAIMKLLGINKTYAYIGKGLADFAATTSDTSLSTRKR